ncbi:MAG: hypothetical protein WC480_02695 [Patescibacteria group bacterium]
MVEPKQNKKVDFDLDDLDELVSLDSQEFLTTERIDIVKKLLVNIRTNIDRTLQILDGRSHVVDSLVEEKIEEIKNGIINEVEDSQVVEGVFDGQQMIGADGQKYTMPANYASKSKLVEGDILKLVIDSRGNFVYKQIGPIERDRVKATLYQDKETNQYYAVAKSRRWKLLTASVTYFKGKHNDEIAILVPKGSVSQWAALENIIKK